MFQTQLSLAYNAQLISFDDTFYSLKVAMRLYASTVTKKQNDVLVALHDAKARMLGASDIMYTLHSESGDDDRCLDVEFWRLDTYNTTICIEANESHECFDMGTILTTVLQSIEAIKSQLTTLHRIWYDMRTNENDDPDRFEFSHIGEMYDTVTRLYTVVHQIDNMKDLVTQTNVANLKIIGQIAADRTGSSTTTKSYDIVCDEMEFTMWKDAAPCIREEYKHKQERIFADLLACQDELAILLAKF
jgi:hypothetical protein